MELTMRTTLRIAALLVIVAASTGVFAQVQTRTATTPAVDAFEHYELVRSALAADNLPDALPHAKTLAQKAEAAGGPAAKKAADAVASAANIEEARKHFGELSTLLVPVFQAAEIPGTTAYVCPMKQKPWVQRGDKMANPYYGKAMLTCGTVLPAKTK